MADEKFDTPSFDTLDTLWQDPGPSLSTRTIARRSRGSGRAVLVGGLRPREIHCESLLEASAAAIFLTDHRVADLREQPGTIQYVDDAGATRRHTFDFLVTTRDSRTVAVAVKPTARAARLVANFDRIIRYSGHFADAYMIVTDASLTPESVYNARTILAARRDPDRTADTTVRAIATTLHGQIAIEDLVAASGLGAHAFRAIVRLIDDGTIRLVEPVRIDYGAMVEQSTALVQEIAA